MTQAPVAPQTPPQSGGKKPIFKRTWFIVLLVVVVVGIIIAATNGGKGGSSSTASTSSGTGDSASDQAQAAQEKPDNEKSRNPGIGQPARDGKFEFVVNGVDCSKTELGDQYLSTKAQGTFCIVDLTIKNIGDKAQGFFGENAKLLNAQKQQFSADNEAAVYLNDSSSLYEEINPGNTLSSKVIFDVPAGTAPTAIELHDSAFSGGVTVDLK